MSRTRYKQVAKQLERDRLSVPHFARFGLRNFRFRFRLLGGLVSVTFWLRFLLRSRLVPAMSLETWFPLRPKWFSLHPAPHHGQTYRLSLCMPPAQWLRKPNFEARASQRVLLASFSCCGRLVSCGRGCKDSFDWFINKHLPKSLQQFVRQGRQCCLEGPQWCLQIGRSDKRSEQAE